MIPKVVGYQGFQSYGDLIYPSLKPGKKTLDSNEIWEKTVREEDKQSLYKNSNYHFSVKKEQMDAQVQPPHYKEVKKANKTDIEGVTSKDCFKAAGSQSIENPFLKTGTEHWQSNYVAGIVDPYAKTRGERPQWTYNRPPYVVESKVGPTEYKKHYGQIGEDPREKLDNGQNPRLFDDLRLGTTQEAMHIPGYTGFIPTIVTSSKAVEHGSGANVRTDFMKTNLKENYHTQIPGYAGHIPQSVMNQKIVKN